jgi:dTDP-4-amino-4,6-dideoxygalactose transaminase
VLRVKLKHLDEWNSRRGRIAARYSSELGGYGITIPTVPDWAEPVWHLYVVQYTGRDGLQKGLSEAGISTLIHYPIPPHLQQAYTGSRFATGKFPIAERMAKQSLSLPMGPQLSDQDVSSVIHAIKGLIGRRLSTGEQPAS